MKGPGLWTIRARLTLLTAGLVLAAGGVLVVGGYWWLTVSLPEAAVQVVDGRMRVDLGEGEAVEVPGGQSVIGRTTAVIVESVVDSSISSNEPLVDIVAGAVSTTSDQITREVARRAALQSAVLLALLTAMAVAIGWFAARRALAPVHEMTESARRLWGSSLSERLVVEGPQDEVRELGETFNDLLGRVEESMRREQRLMANVSHELRTPLANQRAVLELALEEPADDSLHAAAATALEQNIRADQLIEQLLLLARVEQSPRADRDTEQVDLAEVVRSVATAPALAALAAPDTEMTVDAPRAVSVSGDSILIERLVGNLLENAVRHNTEAGWVRVDVMGDDGPARIVVANSGPHIAETELESLRQPFRRGAEGVTVERMRSGEGSGLGLSVVDAIARRYQIGVDLRPRQEGGLTVTLIWPPDIA